MYKIYQLGLLTCLVTLLFIGCGQSTQKVPSSSAKKVPKQMEKIPLPYDIPLPAYKPMLKKEKQVPYSYVVWLSKGDNRLRAQEYEKFLKQHQVNNIIPMFELLRTARSWESCGVAEYQVPNRELWHNSIATLKVFNYLQAAKILQDFEVTSVYRDYPTNSCVGGASSSKHLFNAAIDFRLGPENPTEKDYAEIEKTKEKLCYFWLQHGEDFNIGLGVYRSGQIHIDTLGFRTWGPDLTRVSSPCYPLIESQF